MRRRIGILLIFLLAGAVVNVAVAWGCAKWSPVGCEPIVDVRRCDGIGIQLTLSDGRFGAPFADWGTAAGLPMLSLDGGRWVLDEIRPDTDVRKLLFTSASSKVTVLYTVAILPLHPLWPGFAVNTAFYTAILWLLIPGSFVLRRVIRKRRGLCPACAYPMGEAAVCTECGKPLPGRQATA